MQDFIRAYVPLFLKPTLVLSQLRAVQAKQMNKISPRLCQEEGLLSGPERSQFSSWRASEPGAAWTKEPERRSIRKIFSQWLCISPFLAQTVRYVPPRSPRVCCSSAPSFPGSLICRWALRSAPRRSQRHSPTPPITRCRKTPHTHLKKHSLEALGSNNHTSDVSSRGPRYFKTLQYGDVTGCPVFMVANERGRWTIIRVSVRKFMEKSSTISPLNFQTPLYNHVAPTSDMYIITFGQFTNGTESQELAFHYRDLKNILGEI